MPGWLQRYEEEDLQPDMRCYGSQKEASGLNMEKGRRTYQQELLWWFPWKGVGEADSQDLRLLSLNNFSRFSGMHSVFYEVLSSAVIGREQWPWVPLNINV